MPLCAVVLLGEVIARVTRAPLHFGSFRELRTDLLKRNYPATLDATLGYVPTPNFSSQDNHWGTTVSIDGDGLRKNGTAPPPGGELIIAVGDSFTFGDQVDDHESWPAQLERALAQPVKNGGVFGYSFGQAILRGEDLLQRFQPRVLVISFIPDDLRRCTYSRRYTNIPWFDLVGDKVELRGVPVDHSQGPTTSAWKDALGHSALLDAVFASANPQWWFEDEKQIPIDHLWAHIVELGNGLVDRIAESCRAHGTTPLLLLQGEAPAPEALAVLRHAESIGMPTLDLASRYATLLADDESLRARWFDAHMTAAGNAWVAEQLAIAIKALPR